MKISKNIIFYLLTAMTLIATSCDYLDKDPENSIPEKDVDFTDIDNMYMPVSGVYAKIRTEECIGLFGY